MVDRVSELSQLRPISLRDQALAVIRERMTLGTMVPGEIYSASAVAGQLGVSTSPVRDAMLTLVHQGLMETERNRGFRVAQLSESDRRDIYELRLLIEVPAMVRLVESGLVREHEAEYRKVADMIVQAVDRKELVAFLEHDRQFHLGLLAILGNGRLVSIVESLRDHTRLYGLTEMSENGLLSEAALEHHPILDALVGGDSDLCQQLMRTHLWHVEHDWAGEAAPEGEESPPRQV